MSSISPISADDRRTTNVDAYEYATDYYRQSLATRRDQPTQSTETLSEEEQQEVKALKERDTEVRRHEQAHIMAGGQYVKGGARYTYQTGPDGRRYAIGGDVEIDVAEVPDDPKATLKKAQTVRKAALAPADPSGQDYRVAAQARQMELKARRELAEADAEATGIDVAV